jgi:plasmid stabilization system protein ParE
VEVIWTTRALACLAEISDYISQDNPDAARRWVARLVRCAADATTNPLAGRVVPELGRDDVREVFGRSYRIMYRVRDDKLRVLFVTQGSRPVDARDLVDADE